MLVKTRSYRITIADTGEDFMCPDTDHVLRAMMSLGRKGIPSGCHGGGCGVCKIKITSGQYQTLPMSRQHITEEEERAGCALACRTIPKSDLELQVLGKMKKAVTRVRKYGFV